MGSFHVILLVLQLAVIAAAEADQVLDGCPDRCGDVAIPYPFGIGDKCNLDKSFNITCDDSTTPPKAFLETSNINVTDISISEGELQVLQYVASDCYNKNGTRDWDKYFYPSISLTKFTVSSKKNMFTVIGCDTYAFLEGFIDEKKYTTGCMSICDRNEDVNYESCTGVGCCQISSLTPGLNNFSIWIQSYYNHRKVWDFNPCSYAVIAEESQFKFSKTSFRDFKRTEEFPLVLDWAIGDLPCEEAQKKKKLVCNLTSSECFNASFSSGYLCRCLQGFHGNPYHPKGCQDIDECKDPNQCTNGICINLPGSFNCSCLKGYEPVNKTTCAKPNPRNGQPTALSLYISLGVCLGLLTLMAMSLMMYWGMSKRKLTKLKEKFFEKNGGLMLQQRLLMSTEKGPGDQTTTKIFTQEELERATNNYHASRIIGEGGYGIVYKGILENNKFVAIKKSKLEAHDQVIMQTERTEQFINEVVLLMQINHRNVVRLLGCCLETEVPTLVYEFISNGTLFQHLHNKGIEEPSSSSSLSWELRLKIATETAGALAYLHYETTTPIFHRDVKTMNILLDENYTAKVSDFGASRLIPQGDQEQISTLVQGTVGYLDPEYLQSNQLTGKSDVYSFGVVLGELLTGKKAFWFDKSNGVSHILSMFLLSSNEDDDQLHDLIDDEIILNHGNMDIVKGVAKLAKRCLKLKGEERPTMKEVAMELEGLRAAMSKQHPWGEVDSSIEEKEYLLSKHLTLIDEPYSTTFDLECGSTSATTTATYYSSIQNQMLPNDDGR